MTIKRRTFLGAGIALPGLAAFGGRALAQQNNQPPAIQFDMGGKFDRSFNQAAYDGAERFQRESSIRYLEFEVTNPTQREQGLRNLARRNPSVVVGVGFANRSPLEVVSREFPQIKFTLIDDVLDAANVQSVVFREHEGSFLVGMIAAMASRTAKVGFIGGMDIPLIRKFARGYSEGAKHVNANIEVFENMTGTTPSAWNDPSRGGELARSQIARGADVIYAAAGGTGIGVYQACREAGKYAIGVDSNQNHLHPGTMLTSMIKRVDVAVYDAMTSARAGTWRNGTRVLGLRENGVGWALDEHNRSLITADMERRVNEARDAIIAGRITVTDVTAR
ncbi:MAG: BMP family ABC transporter substrate-binding protein [Alphaproteobacteria bacterium]|nr:BMP family ABC transporter substrate-binding protein [Alphaproteobacteria bacterium]